jgi:BirA family biotin operon repressor/biotin-[acetyl-CoA-carboxylase] ligase
VNDKPETLSLHSRNIHALSGYKAFHYEQVASTNEVAKEIAKASHDENLVVIAATQTHGHGRRGRQWLSPMGGVWLSILLRPKITPCETAKLTLITASAVAEAVTDTVNLEAEVKWPNDVLIDGRKVSGILAETCIRGDAVEYTVIGVGVNTNIDLSSFPASLQKSATTLKNEVGREIDNKQLVSRLLSSFDLRYKRLQQGRWEDLRCEWERRARFLGRQVEVVCVGETLVGEALGIDESGALLVRLRNGLTERILVGDVNLQDPLSG